MNYEYREIWCKDGKSKYLVGVFLESVHKTHKQTLNERLKDTKGCYVRWTVQTANQ